MADYSALEGRAIHNKAIELGRTSERYLGLDLLDTQHQYIP